MIWCGRCGSKIPVMATPNWPKTVVCSSCGQTYIMADDPPEFDFGSFLGGLALGTFILGAFIWTGVGRSFAKEAIRRGAKTTKEQVDKWIKAGEEEKEKK